MSNEITVGVGTLILRADKVLVAKRKHYIRPETGRPAGGAGKWAFPGGHVEKGEDYVTAAVREAKEETGLIVTPIRWDGARYDLHTRSEQLNGRAHLTIYVTTVPLQVWKEPTDEEPEKHESWQWSSLPRLLELEKDDTSWLPLEVISHYRKRLFPHPGDGWSFSGMI